jgi:anti-anti-sigma regulatory factor
MHHNLLRYEPVRGEVPKRPAGVIISSEPGQVMPYALDALYDRGFFFVKPGQPVYEGQVVGEHCKDNDIIANVTRNKKHSNVRASGSDDATRVRLSEITQWQFIDRTRTERVRIVIKGDLTEAVNLDKLLPRVVGRISFDMSQVRYMNSLGVREWVRFLHRANAQGYEFHACSPAFIMQASMVSGVLGRGTVVSFFAPYACVECDHQEETLLQSAAVLAANYEAPTFPCPKCDKHMELDDAPERYFAFLMPSA